MPSIPTMTAPLSILVILIVLAVISFLLILGLWSNLALIEALDAIFSFSFMAYLGTGNNQTISMPFSPFTIPANPVFDQMFAFITIICVMVFFAHVVREITRGREGLSGPQRRIPRKF